MVSQFPLQEMVLCWLQGASVVNVIISAHCDTTKSVSPVTPEIPKNFQSDVYNIRQLCFLLCGSSTHVRPWQVLTHL